MQMSGSANQTKSVGRKDDVELGPFSSTVVPKTGNLILRKLLYIKSDNLYIRDYIRICRYQFHV